MLAHRLRRRLNISPTLGNVSCLLGVIIGIIKKPYSSFKKIQYLIFVDKYVETEIY